MSDHGNAPTLAREMGLLGLAATGICAMLGAGINVIPIMIQRNVPGIGPHVLSAYALAALPAVLAAVAYAVLASAMPRAGGSYVYASRALHPFLGFVASFSQWFGLCVAIGVVAYLLVPFLRDIAIALSLPAVAATLDGGVGRVTIALAFLWTFAGINVLGVKVYERTLVPLMVLMFAAGMVVIVAGFAFDHADFAEALSRREDIGLPAPSAAPATVGTMLPAAVVLFSSFIGFDAIAQAGGEARHPNRTLPLAIGLAVGTVGTYYLLFTAAVYHAVPWSFIADRAATTDLTAPGLLGYLLPRSWTVVIVGGAATALINDLPAMLLSVSRLMFAWAEDGVFPRTVAAVHRRWRTPHIAIVVGALMASGGVLGSHLAGDFFLGVDLLVTSMLVNFLLVCLAVLALPTRRPALAREIRFLAGHRIRAPLAAAGAAVLGILLVSHITKDLRANLSAWYYHSTVIWLIVMTVASLVFVREWRRLRRSGVDVARLFSTLPPS